MKLKTPKPRTGYGYVGTWNDGSIGWMVTDFISGAYDKRCPDDAFRDDGCHEHMLGQRLFLCEIRLVPIKDKRGRPITKIIPNKEDK